MANLCDIIELYKGTEEQGIFEKVSSLESACDAGWDCDCHGDDCYGDCAGWAD